MVEEVKSHKLYQQLTMGVVNSLDKREGVTNVKLVERPPVERHMVISWEQKFSCMMPEDVKNFYLTTDGLSLTWSIKMSEGPVPLGSLEINPLAKLTRMAGISGNNQATPSLADLEPDSDEEKTDISQPHFDSRSRIFEIDSCDGFSKVCLVYRDTKPGIPATKPEVWFLDRSLRWHFLADTFTGYFRMMFMHLGLPQWQYAFTDIGLSPQAGQWFHLYAPVRLDLDVSQDASVFPDDSQTSSSVNMLDVGRVFKGKAEKKKNTSTNSNVKKKPGLTTSKSQNPVGNRATASSSQLTSSKPHK